MRPERSRETGRAARLARGRLVLKADLAWLGGHPTGAVSAFGIEWCVPAAPGRMPRTMHVGRAGLHRATRAVTELELRFGDVLGDIVDEPRAWLQGARTALGLLKPLVNGPAVRPASIDALLASGALRPSVAMAIRTAPPSLRFALDASAWMALVDPPRLGRIVPFVLAQERLAATLRAVLPVADADRTMLHLALLADAEGSQRLEPLVRLLSNRTLYDSPTTGTDYARALAREPRARRAPRPGPTVGPALATWTGVLLGAEPRARRGTLALLEVLELAPAAHEWTAWWSRLARCERLAMGEAGAEADARIAGKATRLADAAPRSLHGETLTWMLTRVLGWDEAMHREALRALRELPAYEAGVPVRLAFLEQWNQLADEARDAEKGKAGKTGKARKESKLPSLLAAVGRYVARTRPLGPRAMAPWARLLDRRRRGVWSGAPEGSLVEHVAPERWPVFYDALAMAAEDETVDVARFSLALLAVLPLVSEPARALALARAMLPDAAWNQRADAVRVAFELCGDDPPRFGQTLSVLAKSGDRNLLRAVAAVRKHGGDALALASLLEEPERLMGCGRALAVLAWIGGGDPIPRAAALPETAWIAEYPAWAQDGLQRLAAADAHAERLARRLLGDEVRATPVMRRELAHLESLQRRPQGVSDRMRRRIDNLRSRLAAPRQVPASVRAHLAAKVERAARRARLASLASALDAAVRERLPVFLGIEGAPEWLFTPRTLSQLAPVHAFDAPMKALAARVMRVRAGPRPWDLRDDPANRAFLQRLTRAGIDVQPWLDGLETRRVTGPKGQLVDLRLEDDPLEILDMGKHFATCLTPGDINYFSTFANIADANKRVLFARSPEGKVQGRCLLALTAAGGIVAFHPYAHDGELGGGEVVRAYARELATRMRTMVVDQGDVPLLVAPDWYDDGAVDLGGRFPFLADGTDFRRSLETLTPTDFLEEARRLFAPLPLAALTLPLLVALPEMDRRPELLVPLLPALAAAEGLPVATVARAAGLLAKTPEAAAAARALVPRIVARLEGAAGEDQGWTEGAVQSVVEAAPSEVLRLLRATRPRRVRSWSDEHDVRRLEMAARAYEVLHRPRLAATLYRLAATHAWTPAARKAFEGRAAALEAGLSRR
jgi:hypothetical protein